MWLWILIGIVVVVLAILLSPLFALLSLVVLITGIVSLAKGSRTWLRFGSRSTAIWTTAAAAVVLLVTGSISSAAWRSEPEPVAAATAAPVSSRIPTGTPTPTPTVNPDEAEPIAFAGTASTVADTSATAGAALATLATLEVRDQLPAAGFAREQFGQRWLDVDRNGCDTRNDTLARDLTDVARSGPCKVTKGRLVDPYTGQPVIFQRGQGTSELVQIDHVVSLANAWETGGQQLTPDQRATFANDPLNLLAVSGEANSAKGNQDAASWLPSNTTFRCAFVARQVSVKAMYKLWVTPAERAAMERVLTSCPEEPSAPSTFAAVAAPPPPVEAAPQPVESAPAEPAPAPAPAEPEPAPAQPAPPSAFYANCTEARAAGAAPIHAGQPGSSSKLDRDGDGVACE